MPLLSSAAALVATVSVALAVPYAQHSERQACTPRAIGAGPRPSDDTPEAFQAYAPFADAALSAATPAGYVQSYRNLQITYNEPTQFIDYDYLQSYDVNECMYFAFRSCFPPILLAHHLSKHWTS